MATEVVAEHVYFTGKTSSSEDPGQTGEDEQLSDITGFLASAESCADLVDELNNMVTSDDDYPF